MDTKQDISQLAASLPQPLSAVIAGAHELAGRITPTAVGSGANTYRLGEARRELALASSHLSTAVSSFQRVAELLKQGV
jgi:hypothetical protein